MVARSYGFQRTTVESTHKGVVHLDGSWRPNGTSAPTVIHANWIDSIAYAATGVWTITMKTNYRKCNRVLGCFAKARFGALEDEQVQGGEVDMNAGTIVVRGQIVSTGAATTIASDADNWVDMLLILKYNNAPDGSLFTT